MVKRFSELQNIRAQGNALSNGRGYLLADIEQIRSFGTSRAPMPQSSYFAFYIYGSGASWTLSSSKPHVAHDAAHDPLAQPRMVACFSR